MRMTKEQKRGVISDQISKQFSPAGFITPPLPHKNRGPPRKTNNKTGGRVGKHPQLKAMKAIRKELLISVTVQQDPRAN